MTLIVYQCLNQIVQILGKYEEVCVVPTTVKV